MEDTIEEFLNKISPEIIPSLQKGDIVVSGSLAMYYCMKKNGLEPGFLPNDIDFYMTYNRNTSAFDDVFNRIVDGETSATNDYFFSSFREYDVDQDVSLGYVIKSTLKNGFKADLIQISRNFKGTSCEFILECFDFDFCKCWYDGIEMHGNLESLQSKSCVLKELRLFWEIKLKPITLVKYAKVIRKFNENKVIKYDPLNVLNRIRKYTKRGFTIDTSQFFISPELIRKSVTNYVWDFAHKQYQEIRKREKSFHVKELKISITLY